MEFQVRKYLKDHLVQPWKKAQARQTTPCTLSSWVLKVTNAGEEYWVSDFHPFMEVAQLFTLSHIMPYLPVLQRSVAVKGEVWHAL